MEVWRDIKDFPGYQVSNQGRIRTLGKVSSSARYPHRVWKDRIIKNKIGKDRCSRVDLWKDGKHYCLLVHRLEAVAFLGGDIESDLTVNHIDGNRQNNDISNLEWLTRADNIKHGFMTGLYNNVRKKCCLVSCDGKRMWFDSMSEASFYLERSIGYVSMCFKHNWKAKDKNNNAYTIITENEIGHG